MKGPAIMLAICAALFLVAKALVGAWRLRGLPLVAFLVWPGMKIGPFLRRSKGPLEGAWPLVRRGLGFGAFGAWTILWGVGLGVDFWGLPVAPGWIYILPGLSLLLHFGIFTVVAGVERGLGFDVEPVFREPLAATSLGDFWSRRWNRGFSEMIQQLVYEPLAKRTTRPLALLAGFAVSGLLHEAAISVPAGGNYGRPFAYFMLHGGLVLVERRFTRLRGHIWTLVCLGAPLGLVFHEPFLTGVVRPLVGL